MTEPFTDSLPMRPPASRNRAHFAAAVVLGGVLLSFCGPEAGDGSTESRDGPAHSKRPSILLVSLDTTRADRLGCYGQTSQRTPNLDRWAAEGVVFENAATPVPITLPAHASLMTGLVPNRHGVRDNGVYRLPENIPVMANLLAEAGYDTAAAVGSAVLDRQYGLARGFARYDDHVRREGGLAIPERDAASVTDAALELADTLRRPFLLFVHYFDPHADYRPPPPFADTFRARPYEGEIAFVDQEVGRLRRGLEDRGLLDGAVVLVTADHGESLGEHGEPTHGVFLYQATVRIPLILVAPGRVPAGARSHAFARLTDVLPTLLDLAGVAIPDDLDGRSLVQAAGGIGSAAGETRWLLLESDFGYESYGWSPLRGIMDGRTKWIRAPRPELYDLSADPGELRNLAEETATETVRLEGIWRGLYRTDLRAHRAGDGSDSASGERFSRLASLGYLVAPGRPRAGDSGLPDPKDVIGTLERINEARRLPGSRRPDAALSILAPLVEKTPGNLSALILLGSAYIELGRAELATTPLREAAVLAPQNADVQFNLGIALMGTGDPAGAEQAWRTTLVLSPRYLEAAVNLADLLLRSQRGREARELLRAARAQALESPLLDYLEGRAALDAGDPASAREALLRALSRPLPPPVARDARYLLATLSRAR